MTVVHVPGIAPRAMVITAFVLVVKNHRGGPMSYVKAKQSFKDAQKAIKSNHDVALLGIVEGLLHLTTSLEHHLAELHSEIVRVRKVQGGPQSRKTTSRRA